jgi:hypothetical protein
MTLREWNDRLTPVVLAIDGVHQVGINDRRNRIKVGVESIERQGPEVEKALRRLSIPREAVIIEETLPLLTSATLQDKWRPILSGIKTVWTHPQLGNFGLVCTLGFVAVRQGVRGFVTNAHCTQFGTVNSQGTWWQDEPNVFGSADAVGVESVDPALFAIEPCPSGRLCRYSDANFNTINADVTSDLGMIPLTAYGSLTWNGSSKFRVTDESPPVLGDLVHKVGLATGRTSGTISETCIALDQYTQFGDTGRTMLCQAVANVVSDSGDSGAPVFFPTNVPESFDVALVGILWGADATRTLIGFSRLDLVEDPFSELGELTNCAPPFPC